jgi:hypothetical protein
MKTDGSEITVVESYELTGKHTYLPMSITIGCLLVLLLALAALYKDLGPRSNQREMKAAISATFKLGISQELSSEKNEPAPITENGDAYKEGKGEVMYSIKPCGKAYYYTHISGYKHSYILLQRNERKKRQHP